MPPTVRAIPMNAAPVAAAGAPNEARPAARSEWVSGADIGPGRYYSPSRSIAKATPLCAPASTRRIATTQASPRPVPRTLRRVREK